MMRIRGRSENDETPKSRTVGSRPQHSERVYVWLAAKEDGVCRGMQGVTRVQIGQI